MSLHPTFLLAVFVTAFVAGAGWTLGGFAISALVQKLTSRPTAK